MNVRLVLERKRKRIWTTHLRRSESTLGRAAGCTIRIPSAEVSRLHCRLRIENGLVFVEDLESVNGTFVNGEPVRGSEIVHPGDRLSLGAVTFVVEYELTQEALKHLGGDEDVVLEADDDDLEVVEEAAVPTVDSAPVLEPVEEVEEAGEEMFQLEEAEEMHLPEGGELRDFLIDLDDTDEPAK
ncbi:MAG TPA: FHA domain-containing protein [Gemmataceae bacterium]|nr:FHA domain-containing protein [Gemmataceae bacterium]